MQGTKRPEIGDGQLTIAITMLVNSTRFQVTPIKQVLEDWDSGICRCIITAKKKETIKFILFLQANFFRFVSKYLPILILPQQQVLNKKQPFRALLMQRQLWISSVSNQHPVIRIAWTRQQQSLHQEIRNSLYS